MTSDEYESAVLQVKQHIIAGDIFQIVISQRFECRTLADPFEIYRTLRVVNPVPYMTYLQARGCILVGSSPEILTRVKSNTVVNRPLAGTVRRGRTPDEDAQLEKMLLSDEKQCAEHIMLVDLGRNDVGKSTRESTLTTLDAWVAVTHLDKMVPYITASLTDAKLGAEGRLAEFPDAIQLLRPVTVAMMDKSADVRKAAEACFGDIVRVCGREMVMKNVRDIQGPALAIVLERLKTHGAFPEVNENKRTVPAGQPSKTGSKIGKSNGHASRHGSKSVSSAKVSSGLR